MQITRSITLIPFEGGLFMSANYCRECGVRLTPQAKFCSACGTPVYWQETPQAKPFPEPEASVQTAVSQPTQQSYPQPTQQPYTQPTQYQYSQQPVQQSNPQPTQQPYTQPAQYQYSQRLTQQSNPQPTQQPYTQPAQYQYSQQPVQQPYPQQTYQQPYPQPMQQPYGQPVYSPPMMATGAAVPEFVSEQTLTGTGELGIDLVNPASSLTGNGISLPNPVGALFGGLGRLLSGPFVMFAHIKGLLLAAAISVLWIWLADIIRNGGSNTLTDILSVLTYAKGGTYGTTVNLIGEYFGKAIVAGGFCSLLYGGIPKIGRGLKAIFTTKGFNTGTFLIGLSVAMACGKFLAGEQMGLDGIMVGICGAMCSLEAIAQKNGFISNLAASFSRRKQGITKALYFPQFKSLLAGGALGFLASSALGAARIYLTVNIYWVFLGVFVIGVVISLATKGKAGAAV